MLLRSAASSIFVELMRRLLLRWQHLRLALIAIMLVQWAQLLCRRVRNGLQFICRAVSFHERIDFLRRACRVLLRRFGWAQVTEGAALLRN